MSCIVKPEKHQLWDELFEYLGQNNRRLVKYWYTVAHDQEFLDMARGELEFNSEGEPTFASLMRAAGTTEYSEKIKSKLGEQLGVGEMTYEEALGKLQSFNRTTSFKQEYMATIVPITNNKVLLSITENTTANQRSLHRHINERSLVDRIKYYLNRAGVDYAFLEEDSPIDGRYSTENAEKTADGLEVLIKVAKGEKVTPALAEEAGHFAIGALGKSPLVSRLIEQLDEDTMKAILGEDYYNKNLGNNPKREVAGYLVGQAILDNVDTKSIIGRLASRIWNAAKQIFANLKGDTVTVAKIEAQNIANRIARSFMSEDFEGTVDNALQQQETLYSREKSGAEKLFRLFENKIRESQAILKNFFPEKAKILDAVLENMEAGVDWSDTFAQQSALVGIANGLMALADIAKDVQQAFLNIDEDFSDDLRFWDNFYMNSKNLRFCSEFCLGVLSILEAYEKFTSPSVATPSNEKLPSDPRITMFDRTAGRNADINLQTLANNLKTLITGGKVESVGLDGKPTYTDCRGLFVDVQTRQVDFFTKFCECSLGRKYIIRAKRILVKGFRIKKIPDTKYTVREMIEVLREDSGMMNRLFGSMGNSNDVISQIVYKAYKTAQRKAQNNVIDVQDRLRALIRDAEDLGIRNDRMYCAVVEEDFDYKDFLSDKCKVPNINEEDGYYYVDIPKSNPKEGEEKFERFVFKKYPEKGALTGDITSLYDEARYEWEYKEFKRYKTAVFKASHPELNPNSQEFLKEWENYFKGERFEFIKKTHSFDGKTKTLNDSYLSKEYAKNILHVDTSKDNWRAIAKGEEKAPSSTSERTILNRWKQIKKEMDAKLPEFSTSNNRLPQFRGDATDVTGTLLKMNKNVFSARISAHMKSLRDSFSLDAGISEGDYGCDIQYTLDDDQLSYNPHSILSETAGRIPLYGINRIEDTSRLSTDIFGSLLKYANMACTYESMDFIVHALEIGKTVLGQREYSPDKENPKKKTYLPKKVYRKLFRKVSKEAAEKDRYFSSGFSSERLSKATGYNTNAYCKYAHFLDKQLYGNSLSSFLFPGWALARRSLYKWARGVSIVMGLSNIIALGGSPMVAGVSLLDGLNLILQEANTGEYFNKRDIAIAHAIFLKYMTPNWFTYFGVRLTHTKFRDDKLSLLIRQFNIDENNDQKFRNWNTKTRLQTGKAFNDLMYLPLEAGTIYMNVIPYLAIMVKTKLINTDGEETSLWNAWSVSAEKWKNVPDPFEPPRSFEEREKTIESDSEVRRLTLKGTYFTSKENRDLYMLLEEELKYVISLRDTLKDSLDSDVTEHLAILERTIPEELVNYFKSKNKDIVDDRGFLNIKSRRELNGWIDDIKTQLHSLSFNEQDEAKVMAQMRQVTNYLHGIYDRDNKGVISQSLIGQMWACMKGYMFGMIARAYTGNRYNIFNERETGRTFTDENGVTVPILDGEMEGFMRTSCKALMCMFGSQDDHLLNIGRILGASLAAITGIGQKWGKQALSNVGFSEGAFYNLKRAASVMIASIGMTLLVNLLKGGEDEEDELEYGNPYARIKIGDIKSKDGRNIVKKLEEMWEDGVDPQKNYLTLLLKYPDIFKSKETYELVQKISDMYDKDINRTCNYSNINWSGIGVYFLTRCQRDNNAFMPFVPFTTYGGNFIGDRDNPATQEIKSNTSMFGSIIAFGTLSTLYETASLIYGDIRYGSLQNNKIAFLNKIEEYQKLRKEQGLKYMSKTEIANAVINYYNKTGEVAHQMFAEDVDFLQFMSENQDEFKDIKELDKNLLNEYFYASKTFKADKGEAKWEVRLKTMIPWIKAQWLLYNPEETLDSYMFAVRK